MSTSSSKIGRRLLGQNWAQIGCCGGVGLIAGPNDFVILVVLNVTSRFEKLKIITTLLQPGQKCVVLIDRQDLIACYNITRISIQRQRKMTHLFI